MNTHWATGTTNDFWLHKTKASFTKDSNKNTIRYEYKKNENEE
jgi:hypothetical protein|tara:strand:- start:243 stop:371 length:129 start_codon:yes stop_codon:yes gene_type:complete